MKNLYIILIALLIIITSATAQTVAPVKGSGSKYSFTNKNLYFEVDTAKGARISSFKLNNKEILYQGSKVDMNGSTFWPSPQYPSPPNWGWPPIVELDNQPYTTQKSGTKIIMKSKINSKYKLRAYKVFWADERDTSITIEYYLKNENTTTKSYAPWEITRVKAEGLTLFGKGSTVVSGNMAASTSESLGAIWYKQSNFGSGDKFFCDGLGWLAHVNPENQLFIKIFENIDAASAAAGEAEIEVYTATDRSYTELENQGSYVSIPAGDSIGWKVRWYARDLPAGTTVAVGEQKLLDFVTNIANLPVLPEVLGYNLVSPEKGSGSKYFFNSNSTYLEIDTANGARITSLKLNNSEQLYLQSTSDMNGSTFWPSPQSFWNWPPISEIDNMPFSARIADKKMILTGKINDKYKLRVVKEISADWTDTTFILKYYLKNENTVARSYAPWEITRVAAEGLTFFGKGDTKVTGDMASNTEESAGCFWYDQSKSLIGNKFFLDGLGWLAHVNPKNEVFIKKFENIDPTEAASGEAEIEIYTAPGKAYTELENQGAYVSIEPGDSVGWQVKWYVRKLNSGIAVQVGSQDLIDFVINAAKLTELPDNPISVSNLKLIGSNLKFYPNPATDYINLAAACVKQNQTVSIYNYQGVVVLKKKLEALETSMNVSILKSGNYIIELSGSEAPSRGILRIIK